MSNFYIPISKGLLEAKHRQKMQVNQKTSAIWLYLWLLDKQTKNGTDGLGVVLGGKPLKLEEIDLGYDIKTTRKMLHQLEKEGYIVTRRTPYGRVIWVTKAKKIFGKKVERELPHNGRSDDNNAVGLGSECGRSQGKNAVGLIKTRQLDKTITHTPAEPEKDLVDSNLIVSTIEAFTKINPAADKFYARPPQREACARLIKLHGLEKLLKVIAALEKTNRIRYFPSITSPIQLEDKWVQLESAWEKKKSELSSNKAKVAFA